MWNSEQRDEKTPKGVTMSLDALDDVVEGTVFVTFRLGVVVLITWRAERAGGMSGEIMGSRILKDWYCKYMVHDETWMRWRMMMSMEDVVDDEEFQNEQARL